MIVRGSTRLKELRKMEEFEKISPQQCVQSKTFLNGGYCCCLVVRGYKCQTLDISVQICIKPIATDIHVSGSILREGAWEKDTVNNVIGAMNKFQDATFLGRQRLHELANEIITFNEILAPTLACTPWWWPP